MNAPVWHGGMLETGIGRAGNVALASLPNFKLPGDISASKRYYKEDLVEPEFEVAADGTMAVPNKPGIGVEVVMERLERVTLKREIFERVVR
jgi:O-succinylbenzoate synthase